MFCFAATIKPIFLRWVESSFDLLNGKPGKTGDRLLTPILALAVHHPPEL